MTVTMEILFTLMLLIIAVLLVFVLRLAFKKLFSTFPILTKKPLKYLFDSNTWLIAVTVIITSMILFLPDVWVDNIINDAIPKSVWQKGSAELDEKAGARGDTFGGTYGPLIAWFAAIVTFAAFWVQYKANEQTRDDIKLERFETRFFELVDLHIKNLDEIQLYVNRKLRYNGEIKKERKELYTHSNAFLLLFDELRFIFDLCNDYNRTNQIKNYVTLAERDILRVAYTFFYAGVGTRADVVSEYIASGYNPQYLELVRSRLKTIQSGYIIEGKQDGNNNLVNSDELHENRFTGHLNFLGKYYRHLYKTVKYVVSQDENFLSYDRKREYLSILRAQLSDFEQLMLYYNSAALFGDEWNENGYFTKYRMIHNMPLPLANFGVTPDELFAQELENENPNDPIFEWA